MKCLVRFGMSLLLIAAPILLIAAMIVNTGDTIEKSKKALEKNRETETMTITTSAKSAAAAATTSDKIIKMNTAVNYSKQPVVDIVEVKNDIVNDVPKSDLAIEAVTEEPVNNDNISDWEMQLFATVVSSETGYCEDTAQKAVAHTIINRLRRDDFPNTIYEVLTQENQYTAVQDAFNGQYREGLEPGSDGWNHTLDLCYEALNEWDFTGGAVAYYNPEICGWNDWFESLTLTYEDSHGRFFTW